MLGGRLDRTLFLPLPSSMAEEAAPEEKEEEAEEEEEELQYEDEGSPYAYMSPPADESQQGSPGGARTASRRAWQWRGTAVPALQAGARWRGPARRSARRCGLRPG